MFSSSSFSTVSFSPKSFFFGVQGSASSGMRRLQMYQMQEEALKKEEQKTLKDVVKEAVEPAVVKKKSKQALPKLVKLVEYEKPEIPRKPIYSSPTEFNPDLAAMLHIWSMQTDEWLLSVVPLLREHRQVIIKRNTAAANDADYRLRLLLLAA